MSIIGEPGLSQHHHKIDFATSCRTLLALVMLAGCAPAERDAIGSAPEEPAMIVASDVEIPMRDGVVLRADIFRPAAEGRFPVLVYRTPYNKHGAVEYYQTHLRAVERGYAVILQDVRGRYASDGIFEPYRNDGIDGYDTIEWAAVQPWSNGDVGTFGLSYPGAVQWLAAIESPPSLKAMVPAMTYATPRRFFYSNGLFDLSWLPWIHFNIAPDTRERNGMPGVTSDADVAAEWDAKSDYYLSYLPLSELPDFKDVAPYYYEWMQHPPEDPWWDWAELRGRYDDVDAAVLNLSGWYDDPYGPDGAINNHAGMQGKTSRLIMGPWKHGVIETGAREVGELDFGPEAGIDYDEVVLRFFDEYLRGQDTGLQSEPPVNYFVMGSNEWHTADTWPPPNAEIESLCLGGAGYFGWCDDMPAATSTSWTADPENPVPDPYDSYGPHDYQALTSRTDVITFDSEVLDDDLTVAGNAIARLFVSCDCKDFDVWVRLQDVYPDGRAFNLRSPGTEVLRASYREPDAGQQLLEPGQVYELRLDRLMFGNTFRAGHKIRVQVSATFGPNLSRNLQTGESEITSSETKIATITIHHSEEYPSALELPFLP